MALDANRVERMTRSDILEFRDPSDWSLPMCNMAWDLNRARDALESAITDLNKPDFKPKELLTKLEDIGSRSLEVHALSERRSAAVKAMKASFKIWKAQRGFGAWIEKDSPTYQRMVTDMNPAFERIKELRRLQKNAQRRLDNAIARYLAPTKVVGKAKQ